MGAAEGKETRYISIDDLVIGKGQVRVHNVGKDIDELASSIAKIGLIEPITVCASSVQKSKYEIITGQRRFLAHKQLGKKSIKATIIDRPDDAMVKAISLSENLVRRDLSTIELVDVCTELFNTYGTIKDVAEKTGLSADRVRQFVKFPRLAKGLQQAVKVNKVTLAAALKAQDVADENSGKLSDDDILKLAGELTQMSGAQQKKVTEELKQSKLAAKNIDGAIEKAKSGSNVRQIVVTLSASAHAALKNYSSEEKVSQDDAASALIEEALAEKGFLDDE